MRTLLLNLVLLLVLLPCFGQEARGESAIYFLGKALDKAEELGSSGVGKATWNPDEKTLTLENFHEKSVSPYGGLYIDSDEDFTIVLKGENAITCTYDGAAEKGNGIYYGGKGRLAIMHGDREASLTLIARNSGIFLSGTGGLHVNNVDLTCSGVAYGLTSMWYSANLRIMASNVIAAGAKGCINNFGSIELTHAAVVAPAGAAVKG